MRRAFVMGSNGPPGANQLRYAHNDAKNIKACLKSEKCGFVVEMATPNKDAWDIRKQLSTAAGSCSAEDTFVCYFSGHGILRKGDLFLLWDKSDLEDAFNTAIPVSTIRDALKHCHAQNKLLILDCCRAGASVDKTGLKDETRVPVEEVIVEPDNHLALLASSRIEEARELEIYEGSFLTHYIVESLTNRFKEADKDGDDRVSIDDLTSWLKERTQDHNRQYPRHSVPCPYVYGQRRGDFFLTVAENIVWPWPEISGIRKAQKAGIKGDGVIVCVLGTGCDADHNQFRNAHIDFRLIRAGHRTEALDLRGFDAIGTGTHLCGAIAGRDIGIAPGVELLVASIFASTSEHQQSFVDKCMTGLDWILSVVCDERNMNKPVIVAMPFGSTGPQAAGTLEGLRLAISTLVDNFDVLCISPIGNDGPGQVSAPAYFPEVLSVGAVDSGLKPAAFSGGGTSPVTGEPQPDIVGFGVDIHSSVPRNSNGRSLYEIMSGASMATAYVGGIAALYAAATGLQGAALRQKIIDTALPLGEQPERAGAGLARFVS